ncbi:MAG: hypothetical protein AAB645_02290 [Patescibacteria group bacterium]
MFKQQHYNRGQTLLVVVAIFAVLAGVVGTGVLSVTVSGSGDTRNLLDSKSSYLLAESGVEDVVYRLKNNQAVSTTEVIKLGNKSATTTITDVAFDKQVKGTGNANQNIRKVLATITIGEGASFNFGVQSEQGGFKMENSSSVKGNLYSNGRVEGSGSSIIYGDVVSAGPTGLISGIEATGTAYAHTIQSSQISKDAYYQSISGSTVGGQLFPNSPDQATSSLPISDSLIDEWEQAAAAGTVISSPCPYKIISDTTLGPAKITCDLEISGSPAVKLTGVVWVTGNITVENSPEISIDPSLGDRSLAVIADNPSDRLTSSMIDNNNSAVFKGSGGANSYILLISQNKSAETGGGANAINTSNSANGELLLYAGHGRISVNNSADLRQITAYVIHLQNSATVSYKTGMSSILFTTGPGGTWNLKSWEEVAN